MRISDWSSDVCSSDLSARLRASRSATSYLRPIAAMNAGSIGDGSLRTVGGGPIRSDPCASGPFRAARESLSGASPSVRDRKSVVSGKSVSVRVDLGGRRIIQKKQQIEHHNRMNSLQLDDDQ